MDFLRAEIAKRKANQPANGEPAAKVARTAASLEPAPPTTSKATETVGSDAAPAPAPALSVANEALDASGPEASKPEAFNISNDEARRRLRQKGQPIRLFAETDRERRLRLRALELIEERGGSGGQRNEFMRTLEKLDQHLELEKLAGGGRSSTRAGTPLADLSRSGTPQADGDGGVPPADRNAIVDLDLVKKDPHRVYPQIYWAFKTMLKDWEAAMNERPETIKRSAQGKQAAATQQQSAEYLKPLFKMIRKRNLEADILPAVAEIAHNMQMRRYVKANDSYLRLSIGNAAWPIGVTMVGIHERSAREKISNSEVAHALNDEVSRKWIQSLKRLLTFAQAQYPPTDHSQRMG